MPCRKGTLSKLLSLNSPSAAYCKTADPGFAASHRSPASLSGQPRLTVQQTSAPFDMPTYIPARQPLPAAQLFDNVRGAWPPSPMPACLALGLCCAAQVHLDRLPATGDRLRQVLDSNFGIKSVLMPNFQSDSRSQLGQLLPSVEDTNARSQYARSQCARSQHALSQPSTRSAPDAASAPVPTWLQLQHSSTHEVPDAFDWSSVSIGARSQLHPASLPVPAKQLPQVLASGYNGSPTWSTEAVPNQVAARIPLPAAQLGAVLAETVPPKLSWLDLATTQPPQAVPITQPLRVDHLLETIPENGPVSDDGSCWTDTASDMSVSDNRSSQSDTDLDAVLAADYELPRDDKPGHTR